MLCTIENRKGGRKGEAMKGKRELNSGSKVCIVDKVYEGL